MIGAGPTFCGVIWPISPGARRSCRNLIAPSRFGADCLIVSPHAGPRSLHIHRSVAAGFSQSGHLHDRLSVVVVFGRIGEVDVVRQIGLAIVRIGRGDTLRAVLIDELEVVLLAYGEGGGGGRRRQHRMWPSRLSYRFGTS